MRVLLTEPLSRADGGADFSGVRRHRLNFGFACLSAWLKARGHEVTIADPDGLPADEYRSLVRNGRFGLAGMSVWTCNVLQVYRHARTLKEIDGSIRVVAGGVHASLFPEELLRECASLDFVIAGEGERGLLALAEAVSREAFDPAGVPALSYRSGDGVRSTRPGAPLAPEEFPFPDYAGAGIEKFESHFPHYRRRPSYQLSFSRGCPFRCAFCSAYTVLGHKIRLKPVPAAVEELAHLRDRFGARGFTFLDSTFTMDAAWTHEFCEAYRAHLGLPWCCVTRVDCVGEELVKAMRAAGCWKIGFGFESANEATLRSINKRTTPEQNARAIELCRRHGIVVYGSFILGWPGETLVEAERTVRWALRSRLNLASFHLPHPYPGTRLEELAIEDGGISAKRDWSLYDALGSIDRRLLYVNPLIGEAGMARLQKRAYLRYYASPGALWRLLRLIRTTDQAKGLLPHARTYTRLLASYLGIGR